MEQEPASRPWLPTYRKSLVCGKCAHQGRLRLLHAWNLQAQLIEAAHQAHEGIVNRTITTPQTTTVELTQTECMNQRGGVAVPSFTGEPLPGRFPDRDKGSCTTQRGLAQCKLQNLIGQSRWSRFQTAGTSAVGLHWKGRASELTPPTGAVGGAEACRAVVMRRGARAGREGATGGMG